MREICFGCLQVDPERFRLFKIGDLWSMLKGWDDNTMFNLTIQRQVATIIAETTNRSMGGKGVVDYIMKVFPLPHDKAQEVAEMTPEKITALLDKYNEHMRQKRLRNGGTA